MHGGSSEESGFEPGKAPKPRPFHLTTAAHIRVYGKRTQEKLENYSPYPPLGGRAVAIEGSKDTGLSTRAIATTVIQISRMPEQLSDADFAKNVNATGESSVCSLLHRNNIRYPSEETFGHSMEGNHRPDQLFGLVIHHLWKQVVFSMNKRMVAHIFRTPSWTRCGRRLEGGQQNQCALIL
ncbi:hypothetical protein AVEN_85045-1 [Araneus ventricosus]|uniref:Uncharacterized protein n=1 Tax=Araneus ventricosus TaxID=182803 RepID=A0A4Y2MYW8_ARAVE|nr:hypothetical protein AVEN_85045-1 [Araneus ventricosus]